MHLALSVVTVSLGQFLVPRVANVLPVHHATVIGSGCFGSAEVRLIALGFVAVVQIKVCSHHVVIVLPFGKREICPILVSFLTVS